MLPVYELVPRRTAAWRTPARGRATAAAAAAAASCHLHPAVGASVDFSLVSGFKPFAQAFAVEGVATRGVLVAALVLQTDHALPGPETAVFGS